MAPHSSFLRASTTAAPRRASAPSAASSPWALAMATYSSASPAADEVGALLVGAVRCGPKDPPADSGPPPRSSAAVSAGTVRSHAAGPRQPSPTAPIRCPGPRVGAPRERARPPPAPPRPVWRSPRRARSGRLGRPRSLRRPPTSPRSGRERREHRKAPPHGRMPARSATRPGSGARALPLPSPHRHPPSIAAAVAFAAISSASGGPTSVRRSERREANAGVSGPHPSASRPARASSAVTSPHSASGRSSSGISARRLAASSSVGGADEGVPHEPGTDERIPEPRPAGELDEPVRLLAPSESCRCGVRTAAAARAPGER